jgi:hypothetical protein
LWWERIRGWGKRRRWERFKKGNTRNSKKEGFSWKKMKIRGGHSKILMEVSEIGILFSTQWLINQWKIDEDWNFSDEVILQINLSTEFLVE